MFGPFDIARSLMMGFDPETAHDLAIRAMEAGIHPRAPLGLNKSLGMEVWGLAFPNPIGIAAGFDKDGRIFDALIRVGFGYAEAGTATPLPQSGNPRPRVFRLPRDGAVINRLGFNNRGHKAIHAYLKASKRRGILGVNIGANRDSDDRISDYIAGFEAFADLADYFTVNISSPNTPGLRDLHAVHMLEPMLKRLSDVRQRLVDEGRPYRPIAIKLSPELTPNELPEVVACCVACGADGLVISNTTTTRPNLIERMRGRQGGGLSGRPLFELSTAMLARAYRLSEGKLPLIGVGGVDTGEAALEKIEAGASLIQLYTGLVYEGFGLVTRIKLHLGEALRARGADSLAGFVGSKAESWSDRYEEVFADRHAG